MQSVDRSLGEGDGEKGGKRGAVDSSEKQSVPHPHDEIAARHVTLRHLKKEKIGTTKEAHSKMNTGK